jgi:phage-related protein
MTDTFTPPVIPSPGQGTNKKVTARVLRADFGDGYSQRGPDGLNYVGRALTLVWATLSQADADTIEAFFVAHVALAFYYTPPMESTPLKWSCATWNRSYPGGPTHAISADLMQEFDLGA